LKIPRTVKREKEFLGAKVRLGFHHSDLCRWKAISGSISGADFLIS